MGGRANPDEQVRKRRDNIRGIHGGDEQTMKGIILVIILFLVACCIFIPGAFAWIINTFFGFINWLLGLVIK